MRKLGAILTATMVLTYLSFAAVPAHAETVVDTQSFVNGSGNTVTVTETYEVNGTDVVLVSRSSTEVKPDGTVVMEKSWTFYPDGSVKTSDEYRNSSIAPTKIHREYSDAGVLLFQRSELSLNGELAVVSLVSYNEEGVLLSREDRKLITLADGTQVWEVTKTGYALDGTVIGQTVAQFPSNYNFDAPPAAEPPADEDSSDDRPGYGKGDKNHDHTGPLGHANGAAKNKGKSKDKDK